MKTVLLVPIRTDALFLSEDTIVTEASVDFSRLPYFNGTRDVNADVAFISENVISQPLQDQNLRLKKGVHLHWALPDALTRGRHLETGRTEFPRVPNRWLIAKKVEEDPTTTVMTYWMVESDYLFPEEKDILLLPENDPLRLARRESVVVPVDIGGRESGSQPFRHMGRKIALNFDRDTFVFTVAEAGVEGYEPGDVYDPAGATDRYDSLTAVGYGEPSFAAFYPNCRSVFGFHDPDFSEGDLASYDILGWYSDSGDEFYQYLKDSIPAADFQQIFNERVGWVINAGAGTAEPDQTLLYSEIKVDATGTIVAPTKDDVENLSVVIGNTGTDALSVFLAEDISANENITDPVEIETLRERFEALYLIDKLEHHVLDIDEKYDEARHENGFNSVAGGYLWTISVDSDPDQPANASATADTPALSQALTDKLNEINRLQSDYDKKLLHIQSLGTQLYADWYKYMVTTYPPEDTRVDYPEIDEVQHFIENSVMRPLQDLTTATGALVLASSDEIVAGSPPASAEDPSVDSSAKDLADKINTLFDDLTRAGADLPAGSKYSLRRTGGPRYWEPKDPVILLAETAGDTVKPTVRHGQDGQLECHSIAVDDLFSTNASQTVLETVANEIGALIDAKIGQTGQIGFTDWSGQPWNPFRLDWEVEIAPLNQGSNTNDKDYEEDFITALPGSDPALVPNYKLPVNTQDLVPNLQAIATYPGRNPNIYVGKSLLTPQAKRNMLERAEIYLKEKVMVPFLQDPANADHPAQDENYENPLQHLDEMLAFLGSPIADGPMVVAATKAYKSIVAGNLNLLSQALNGFNDAMIQLRQSYQLPIADPIGFKDYQPFTEAVAELADASTWLAPQPLTDFNPIRTGQMVINQLRLVDTFGLARDIDLGKMDRVLATGTSPSLLTDKEKTKIAVELTPRLAQAARVHFRWLNAETGDEENSVLPNANPVFGWLLTNQLDDSLVVYDATGMMLGSIEGEDDATDPALARWTPAPGAVTPVLPENISNPFLKNAVDKIRGGGKAFVTNFIDGIDSAMSSIEPETFESQQALSLLMGRPLALVRASLNLELMGEPAADQGWNAFYRDRQDGDTVRNRDAFTKVKFPVRIGKHEQFNDGLIGYWKEADGVLDANFLLNQMPVGGISHTNIEFLDDDNISIFQSVDDAPQLMTILMDPRGKVHVTTGVLPVKEINIPPDQYLSAMQRLSVTFLTTPLLTPARNIHVLLPTEEKFEWSWIERAGTSDWREVMTFPGIDEDTFLRAFSDAVLEELLDKNWLIRGTGDQLQPQPEDERAGLDGQYQLVESDIRGVAEGSSTETLFRENLTTAIGNGLWTNLLDGAVKWLEVSGEHIKVLPKEDRQDQALQDFGMEYIVDEILATRSQVLKEPGYSAVFEQETIGIREGWMKLSISE